MLSRLSRLSSDTWYDFFMWLMSVFRKLSLVGFFIFLLLCIYGDRNDPDVIMYLFYAVCAWLGFLFSHPVELFSTFVAVNMFGVKKEESFWNYFNDVRMIVGTATVFILCLLMMVGEDSQFSRILFKFYDYGTWGTIWLNVIDLVKSFFSK